MDTRKRVTVYFDSTLHRALKFKAVATGRSISDLVNEAVRLTIAEDAEDLKALELRTSEPDMDFGTLISSLKRRGRL